MNISKALLRAEYKFENLKEPLLEAEVLLSQVLKKDRSWFKIHKDYKLSLFESIRYLSYVSKRYKHTPVAYITGKKDWAGLEILVNKNVLIPRDETEQLCFLIKEYKRSYKPKSVLDIGTGSGCLALFCKNTWPQATVLGVDVSRKALKVAEKNAKNLELDVKYRYSDLLKNIKRGDSFDIITANLPYLPENMDLCPEVLQEPFGALFSNNQGLGHIKRLKTELESKEIVFKELWLEFLPQQFKSIEKIFSNYKILAQKDIAGEIYFVSIIPDPQYDGPHKDERILPRK